MDKLDRTNMPLETFLAKMENCARYSKWEDYEQLAHLQAGLIGEAAQCLWEVGEIIRFAQE